ncbi:hypothetical protein VTI74DRAFT_4659 [Chaetomium olivicolor]
MSDPNSSGLRYPESRLFLRCSIEAWTTWTTFPPTAIYWSGYWRCKCPWSRLKPLTNPFLLMTSAGQVTCPKRCSGQHRVTLTPHLAKRTRCVCQQNVQPAEQGMKSTELVGCLHHTHRPPHSPHLGIQRPRPSPISGPAPFQCPILKRCLGQTQVSRHREPPYLLRNHRFPSGTMPLNPSIASISEQTPRPMSRGFPSRGTPASQDPPASSLGCGVTGMAPGQRAGFVSTGLGSDTCRWNPISAGD